MTLVERFVEINKVAYQPQDCIADRRGNEHQLALCQDKRGLRGETPIRRRTLLPGQICLCFHQLWTLSIGLVTEHHEPLVIARAFSRSPDSWAASQRRRIHVPVASDCKEASYSFRASAGHWPQEANLRVVRAWAKAGSPIATCFSLLSSRSAAIRISRRAHPSYLPGT